MENLGQTISKSFALVAQVGEQCDALARLTKEELSDLFLSDEFKKRYRPESWINSYQTDPSGWAYQGMAWSLPLALKPKQKPTVYLSLQINFLCNNPEGGRSAEPLLHINLWDTPINFKTDDYMGFPMGHLVIEGESTNLLRWDNAWTYSVKLAHINSRADVLKYIIEPVRALLRNFDEDVDPLKDLGQAVVHWQKTDDVQYLKAL